MLLAIYYQNEKAVKYLLNSDSSFCLREAMSLPVNIESDYEFNYSVTKKDSIDDETK